jgi:hypothetical protein
MIGHEPEIKRLFLLSLEVELPEEAVVLVNMPRV